MEYETNKGSSLESQAGKPSSITKEEIARIKASVERMIEVECESIIKNQPTEGEFEVYCTENEVDQYSSRGGEVVFKGSKLDCLQYWFDQIDLLQPGATRIQSFLLRYAKPKAGLLNNLRKRVGL